MKSKLNLLFGLIILLIIVPKQSICRELNSIKFEGKKNYNFNNFSQDTTLIFEAHIGKYPKYYGLKNALDSIENTINKILQGGVPYKVFSSVNNIPQETYSIRNGIFTYKIILNRCEEKNRYWKFGIAGAFYLADTLITSKNDKEPSGAGSEVRWLLSDKANKWNSIGVTQLSPNNISREDVNKYILERNKNIDIDNSSSKTVSSQHDAFSNGHLFFTCGSVFGIVSNRALLEGSKVDINSPNIKYLYSLVYQDESIKSSYTKNNKQAIKNANQGTFNDQQILDKKEIPSSLFYKYLNESDKKLLVKILTNEINTDPRGIDYGWGSNKKICGKSLGNCKWCGKSTYFTTYYNSVGKLIKSFDSNVYYISPVFSLNSPDGVKVINEMKKLINLVRNKNYYSCLSDSNEDFCSPRCKFEYKNNN